MAKLSARKPRRSLVRSAPSASRSSLGSSTRVASAPTRVASRLGLRGLKRQRALAASEAWAAIEPLVRWLGVRVSGISTDEQRARSTSRSRSPATTSGLTADEYLALCIVSSIAGAAAGAGLAASSSDNWHDPRHRRLRRSARRSRTCRSAAIAQERLKNISRGLPYVIDLMALAMGAGLDFPGAVRQVVEKSSNPNDPLVEEFTLILQTLNLGRTRKDALTEFARRAPVDAVTEFVNALVQAEERGNPVAEVLHDPGRRRRARVARCAPRSWPPRPASQMVGPLMLIFARVMVLVIGPDVAHDEHDRRRAS